jgi:crotonobetainyl-CoA:carnitine CoA-transferase CaiB-like acyl-CoA transferase
LAGLTVVDFSATFAGALATQLLADHGAQVVLIEPPGGSALRRQPAWPAWGRGKESVVLDLADARARSAAHGLAASADVVVETWRPGVAERLGLGYDALSPANPGLVYASVTAFGREGPHAHLPGYEGVVMAKAGAFDAYGGMTARPGPAFVTVPYCSYAASQLLLHGVLAALLERAGSGCGQRVDVSLLHALGVYDTWNWLLRLLAARYPDAFLAAPAISPEHRVPNSSMIFRLLVALSADGRWMQFSQITDKLWEAFLRLAGLDELLDAPEWRGVIEEWDADKRGRFWDRLLAAVRTRTYDEWYALFEAHPDVWAELFRHGTELLHHPQLGHDGQSLVLEDPGLGAVVQPAPLVRMSATPAHVARGAPALGSSQVQPRTQPVGRGGAARRGVAPAVRLAPAGRSAPAGSVPPAGSLPLAGTTIVELATFFAAPYGATLLCDLGARVIKVEPLGGDPLRGILPFPEVAAIKAVQGKESVAVDITTPEGRAIVLELVRRADVVLQSFRAGVAERLGYDGPSLLAANPGLVYLNAPGYGTGGPCGGRPAFAPTIGAASGLAMRNLGASVPERPDLTLAETRHHALRLGAAAMGPANADGCSALGVATALLLGLVARQRGAPGQELTTTMLSTLAHTLSEDMVEYDGRPPAPSPDDDLLGLGPRYRLYEAAEGWVFLAAPSDREWSAVVEVLGGADVEARFRARPAQAWEDALVPLGVACVAVARGPVEACLMGDDGIGTGAGMVVRVEHPTIGEHTRMTSPVRFSRSATRAGPGCAVGHHTDAVLREIGYPPARIAALREAGVVG